MSAKTGTDWAAMLRTAAALGIGPEAFWRLSVREWRMLTAAPAAERPMGRDEMERLAAAWPDQRSDRHSGASGSEEPGTQKARPGGR